MKEIAKTFLAVPHTAPWIYDESASALVNFVCEGGVWDARGGSRTKRNLAGGISTRCGRG